MTIFDTYQSLAQRTEKMLEEAPRLSHAGLGLITESGEIATILKRVVIYGKSLDSQDKDGKSFRSHMGEEIGDVCWYLAIPGNVYNINPFADVFATMEPRSRTGDFEALALELGWHVGAYASFIVNDGTGADLINQCFNIMQVLVDIAAGCNLRMADILEDNIAKLQERFPEAYSDVAAEARADKGGLDARNS